MAHDSASLLRNYLRLIRSLRHQKRAPEVVLRRDDIEVLAKYLHEPEESILDRLAALMGATRTQRTAMLSVFASGALLIGLSSSTAAAPATSSQADGSRPPSPLTAPVPTVVVAELPPLLLPGDRPFVISTVSSPSAGVVGLDTTVPSTVVEIATTAEDEGASNVTTSPRAVVVPSPAPSAPPTTEHPLGSVAAVDVPVLTTEPVVVGVGEPPIAPDAPILDAGSPPHLPDPVTATTTATTTPTTSTSTPTSPGGVGEPPFDEPTPTTEVDPSTVAVDPPPVPTTATPTTTVDSTTDTTETSAPEP